MSNDKTALVLSGGGMFGAWQAGVWKALAGRWQPDIVVGVSAGALNGWAIAGGATPEELIEDWRRPDCAGLARYRLLQPPWRGVFDSRPLHTHVRRLWSRYRPRVPIGVVAVDLRRLRPRLFCNEEIGWEHLAASCAVPMCYRPQRIGGCVYVDGGLLTALPVWAAPVMGATRVIALNAVPQMPLLVRWAIRATRALAARVPAAPQALQVTTVCPSQPLGSVRDALFWDPKRVAELIASGEADGARLMP